MSIEETCQQIQRKIWTLEELIPQFDPLIKNLGGLSPEQKQRMPVFPNDWSEEGVKKYFNDIEKAINEPIIFRNRKNIEENGIKTEGISNDVLGDTHGISNVLALYVDIKKIAGGISDKLVTEPFMSKWLKESIEFTENKLQEIIDAKPAFERLTNNKVDSSISSDLIMKALYDITKLSDYGDLINKLIYLDSLGINIKDRTDLEVFYDKINRVYDKIQYFQTEYGISDEYCKSIIKSKTLSELVDLLDKEQLKYAKEKSDLLKEGYMYNHTLGSFGLEDIELPQSLPELRAAVEKLKNKCLEHIGECGLSLINYLSKGEDFPTEIEVEDIRKTLEVLRPLFIKVLKKES